MKNSKTYDFPLESFSFKKKQFFLFIFENAFRILENLYSCWKCWNVTVTVGAFFFEKDNENQWIFTNIFQKLSVCEVHLLRKYSMKKNIDTT